MSAARLSARAVRGVVRPGQRWQHRKTRATIVVFMPHAAERRVEAYREGMDPRVPHTRFYVAFAELGRSYELVDEANAA